RRHPDGHLVRLDSLDDLAGADAARRIFRGLVAAGRIGGLAGVLDDFLRLGLVFLTIPPLRGALLRLSPGDAFLVRRRWSVLGDPGRGTSVEFGVASHARRLRVVGEGGNED